MAGAADVEENRGILRSFRVRFQTGIGLAALLIVGTSIATVTTVRLDADNAAQVNVSGRQRMLSQRIALTARAAVRSDQDRGAAHLLEAAVEQMRTAHRQLVDPTSPGAFEGPLPDDVASLYFGSNDMDARVGAFLDSASIAVEWLDRGRPGSDSARIGAVRDFVTAQAEGPLLAGLDSVVAAYQADGDAALRRVVDVHLFLTAISLGLLLLLSAVAFRPMGARLAQAFEATREREARLARTQHLHQVGLMASGVAHDLKNYAGVVKGNLQLAREELEERRLVVEELDEALDSVGRIEFTARQLLALTPDGSGLTETLDLSSHLPGLAALLRGAGRPTEVRIDGGTVPARCTIPRRDFESALLNLVGNARDALAGRDDGRIEVRVEVDGERVRVSVTDDGPGVPERIRDVVFQPFVSEKDFGSGSGLGLAQVRAFARAAGGDALLTTGPDGTRVTLDLPRTPD